MSITREKLDTAVVAWVNEVAFDPVRAASRWVEVEEPPKVDPVLMANLAEAERRVGEVTGRVTVLTMNLALVTGPAATVVADQLNDLNQELTEATAERDRLTAEAARLAFPTRKAVRRLSPETVVAEAVNAALEAGWAAYRRWFEAAWEREHAADPELFDQLYPTMIDPWRPEPPAGHVEAEALEGAIDRETARVMPPSHGSEASWHAWQAILSTLGVTVKVNQQASGEPRWVARMELPGGAVEGTCIRQHRC